MSLVWILLYFGIKGGLNFFAMHAVNDLKWSAKLLSYVLMAQIFFSFGIIYINGKVLDRIGRKAGATIIIIIGVASSICAFMLTDFWFLWEENLRFHMKTALIRLKSTYGTNIL